MSYSGEHRRIVHLRPHPDRSIVEHRSAIRYALSRWAGLGLFLDDGRVEIDSNVVERSIRPIALTRKNALFVCSDDGAEQQSLHRI